MKKVWLILGAVIILAVGGVSIYISTIDWNQHKDKIAEQFNDITGKKVVFAGPVSFKLLPSPKLTATNIKVFNPNQTIKDKPLATIKSLEANLSLRPLLSGDFEVVMMSLIEPEMWFNVEADGKLNWQTPLTEAQKQSLEDIKISLDSVLLEKAKVNFTDDKHGIDTHLDNLNGEVIAESVFGPYRIEGSYVKGKNPEGFAISLGQFSESFATSVNFVLNQPASQSYLRFDGTVLLKNSAVNGNLIIESKKFKEFFDSTLPNQVLDENLDYPLALSLELDTNKSRISMSNIVVKFGQSAGAGNILIPLFEDEFVIDENRPVERRQIETAFNMTDLDLTPWVALLKKGLNQQSQEGSVYQPMFDFDVLADLKSIKTTYNGQNIKDFVLSADFVENSFDIRELSGVLPGETKFKLSGDVFSDEEKLTYNLKTELSANDLQKFASWLGYDIEPVAPSTYRRAEVKTSVAGNLKNIKISPLDVTLDKTVVSGEVGIIRGERPQIYAALNSDSINFDNYVKGLPEEYRDKPEKEKMAYRFAQLARLNDWDVDFRGGLDLGIYENVPFENTMLNFKLSQGVMKINQLTIGNVGNAKLAFEGDISGFGKTPQVENLKYDVSTQNFEAFLTKFDLPKPNINLKDLQNFTSQGIVTGSFDRAAMKTVSKLGNWDVTYTGQISQNDKGAFLDGNIEFKTPDFVKFVNALNFDYQPKSYALGLFSLNAKLAKNGGVFKLSDANAFIGANNIKGTIWVDKNGAKPNIVTDLRISRFEPSRFFYNAGGNTKKDNPMMAMRSENDEQVQFLRKPVFDTTRLNYDFYKTFHLSGKFVIEELVHDKYTFKNAQFSANVKDEGMDITNFSSRLNDGQVSGNASLVWAQKPELNLNFNVSDQNIDNYWSGEKYGLRSGRISADGNLVLPASSVEEMVMGAVGKVNLAVQRPVVKGWNFGKIQEDLKTRDRSEGLASLASSNLQTGETVFDAFQTGLNFNKGKVVFEGAKFLSPGVALEMSDESNLETWDMAAEFKTTLAELTQIPPFSFRLSGSMTNPELAVDVKPITDTYDAKWAKAEADKKAAEQARLDHLKELMEMQQNRAKEIKNTLDLEVVAEFDKLSPTAVSEQAKNQYQTLKSEIDKTSSGIDEIFTLGLTQEFDETLPQALSKRNDVYGDDVNRLKTQITQIYVDDLKFQINDTYTKIRDTYNLSKEKANAYRDAFAKFPQRLAKIKTEYNIETDKLVNQLKQDIENNLLFIDEANSQIGKAYLTKQDVASAEELKSFLDEMKETETKVNKELNILDENIERLLDYAAESVSLEEKSYQARVKAAEQAKKVQENIGKISNSSGQNKTIVRDIEDIEKSEKVLSEQPVRVLDFSKDMPEAKKISSSKKSSEKQTPEVKEESLGLIKKATGTIAKASGVIVKKQ